MSMRRWPVLPSGDEAVYIGGEEVPVVTEDDLLAAVMDGLVFLKLSGGSLIVHTQRRNTDLQGHAVTTAAVVQWMPYKNARPEPEKENDLQLPASEPEESEDEEVDDGGAEAEALRKIAQATAV